MDNTLAQRRLYNHHIAGGRCKTPEAVVQWMGAMQAQSYQQALWAIGLRTDSATCTYVEHAIAERKIVRTWPMRGTLHFVPAEDVKWMLQLSAKRMIAADKRRQEQLGITPSMLKQAETTLCSALQGGKRLARPEVMKLLEHASIPTANQRGYHILWYLAQCGILCLGPMQEKQQTFVLLDEWVPQARNLGREEALAVLAERYFTSHGPATCYDFAWWSGLTVADARQGLAGARQLKSEKISGIEYWSAYELQDTYDTTGTYLLPGFDEYLLGYKDRSAVLDPAHAAKVVPGGNGMFLSTVVTNGRVVGTWKATRKKAGLGLELIPFEGDLSSIDVQATAQRYASFLGTPLA